MREDNVVNNSSEGVQYMLAHQECGASGLLWERTSASGIGHRYV